MTSPSRLLLLYNTQRQHVAGNSAFGTKSESRFISLLAAGLQYTALGSETVEWAMTDAGQTEL